MTGKPRTPGFFWLDGPPTWRLRIREAKSQYFRRERGSRGGNEVNEARARMRGIRTLSRYRGGRQR